MVVSPIKVGKQKSVMDRTKISIYIMYYLYYVMLFKFSCLHVSTLGLCKWNMNQDASQTKWPMNMVKKKKATTLTVSN